MIAVARGDGIGPEIMEATLLILRESGADLKFQEVCIGEKVYLDGEPAGITAETWSILRESDAFLKAPVTTPQGKGFKSLNVTVRVTLGLFANVRPCVSYHPFVMTKHPLMDVVIIRENEEDLYMGIEYRQSQTTTHALKVMTRPGCERIIRYAFEYARQYRRKKVTCFTKDNILKISDGLFHQVFKEIAPHYPEIEAEHWIIDIGAAKLATTPEDFDVVVMPNLYGDILSDVAAQITGSVGLAGSANIGAHGAMFEAIHGSAPKRAGQDVANPSGLLLASVMMLNFLGKGEVATAIHNAWLKTLEEGVHTYDIFKKGVSQKCVGTNAFAREVIGRLGQSPLKLKKVNYTSTTPFQVSSESLQSTSQKKEIVGIDLFIEHTDSIELLIPCLKQACPATLSLKMVANKGATVWPTRMPETHLSDTWRCRFLFKENGRVQELIQLQKHLVERGVDLTQTQHLYTFDQEPGYTLSQDEQ